MYTRRTAEQLHTPEARTDLGRSPPPAQQTQSSIPDPFGSSGTASLAAELTRRAARVIELELLSVNLTIHRREQIRRIAARHAEFDVAFAETEVRRAATTPGSCELCEIEPSEEI
jgi:hypothetical protein